MADTPKPTPRVRMPATAKADEVIEVKTLISHEMETGYRHDNVGKPMKADYVRMVDIANRIELGQHIAGFEIFHSPRSAGVLHGEQREDAGAIDAKLMEGLEVGLDTGAAAGIRTRDAQRDRRHR